MPLSPLRYVKVTGALSVKTNMSAPKRHHFVPKSYLERFKEPDSHFLNLYSKRSGLWRRQKPDQVMVRNKYYRQNWAPDGVDPNILEKKLGEELEPKGLESLQRLVSESEELSDDDTANIIAFIEFQRIRVPRQADEAMRLAKLAIETEILADEENRDMLTANQVVIKDSFRFEFMREVSGRIGPYLSRMLWEIVQAPDGSNFITSDSPVCYFNEDFIPPREPGLGLYGTMVFFPLDPKHLLILRHPEYMRGEKKASDTLPRDIDYEDGHIELRRGTVWEKDVVDHFCWVIFTLSQDLIAGCSKESIDKAVKKETSGHGRPS